MSRTPLLGKPIVQRSEATRRVGAMSLPSRRDFLKRSALAGALASGYFTSRAAADSRSPNEKLNIGAIGTANQARFSMNGVKSENLVAICDVDDHFLDKAAQDYPAAKKYNDWRKLLEAERSRRGDRGHPRPHARAGHDPRRCGWANTSIAKSP